ncbi:hypothetical protein BZG36_02975 [Bifiguratus adelaidae]|uniref:3D domain-containing protein n=1 Tax=Bifiguratus adelaidae TaxID=1938954 RepID=A0A261Y0T1_9FUNG|nr:hypothetical protein BZG36_02975 [Bifiguratus adelaidae]
MKLASLSIVGVSLASVCVDLASAIPLTKRAPSCYNGGSVALTNYWIPKQGTEDYGSQMLTGADTTALLSLDDSVIAKVPKVLYDRCQMEGTCKLANGDLINLANNYDRFEILGKGTPFGSGAYDPLVPFVSVASNDLSGHTTVYIKEFDGLTLPNGETHNGCVRVDDNGWSFGGCHLDLFVMSYEYYANFNWPSTITTNIQSCTVKDYNNGPINDWLNGSGNGGANTAAAKQKAQQQLAQKKQQLAAAAAAKKKQQQQQLLKQEEAAAAKQKQAEQQKQAALQKQKQALAQKAQKQAAALKAQQAPAKPKTASSKSGLKTAVKQKPIVKVMPGVPGPAQNINVVVANPVPIQELAATQACFDPKSPFYNSIDCLLGSPGANPPPPVNNKTTKTTKSH